MTKLMDQAVEALSKLPADQQDQLAELMLDLAESTAFQLSAAEEAAIAEGRADIAAGRTASEADINAVFDRLRSA